MTIIGNARQHTEKIKNTIGKQENLCYLSFFLIDDVKCKQVLCMHSIVEQFNGKRGDAFIITCVIVLYTHNKIYECNWVSDDF